MNSINYLQCKRFCTISSSPLFEFLQFPDLAQIRSLLPPFSRYSSSHRRHHSFCSPRWEKSPLNIDKRWITVFPAPSNFFLPFEKFKYHCFIAKLDLVTDVFSIHRRQYWYKSPNSSLPQSLSTFLTHFRDYCNILYRLNKQPSNIKRNNHYIHPHGSKCF